MFQRVNIVFTLRPHPEPPTATEWQWHYHAGALPHPLPAAGAADDPRGSHHHPQPLGPAPLHRSVSSPCLLGCLVHVYLRMLVLMILGVFMKFRFLLKQNHIMCRTHTHTHTHTHTRTRTHKEQKKRLVINQCCGEICCCGGFSNSSWCQGSHCSRSFWWFCSSMSQTKWRMALSNLEKKSVFHKFKTLAKQPFLSLDCTRL